MRKAFTLIEMMIAISILSIMMLFLYKSYAALNLSNKTYEQATQKLKKFELTKEVLYLDFSLASSVKIISRDKQSDIVFLHTLHSIHDRINPYVGYIFKNEKLYRIESLKELTTYPLNADAEFVADDFGKGSIFRVYKSKKAKNFFVLHFLMKDKKEIILKVKALNIVNN